MRSTIGSIFLAAAILGPVSATAAVTVNHILDRSSVFSTSNMCRVVSSGQTLANGAAGGSGNCGYDPIGGDIVVDFLWADGQTASAIWSDPSGKNLAAGGPVLFPGVAAPGVHFDFTNANGTYRGFVEQSGDTISEPWEIRNGNSTQNLVQVILRSVIANGPVMGFDTDDGTDPNHGAAGFLLSADDALSTYAGTIDVTYDLFNNWAGTTDMFHRMTIDFVTPMANTNSLVFRQDTDEIPEPMTIGMVGMGIAAIAWVRRRSA